jgi:hypothetical protein
MLRTEVVSGAMPLHLPSPRQLQHSITKPATIKPNSAM